MSTTPTSLDLDFPPLQEMATEAARRHLSALNACGSERTFVTWEQWGAVARKWEIEAHARLLSDLTRREIQALWLGWLARRLGVVMPEVGSPQWRRVIDMRTSERVIGYAVGPDPFVIDPHSGVAGRAGWLAEGPRLALFTARLDRVGLETLCPALDNPDAADAPIRALALAVEIVANAEQSRAR